MRLNGLSLSLLLGLALTSACGDDTSDAPTSDMGVAADTGTVNGDASSGSDGSTESDASSQTLTKAAFIEAFPAAYAGASLACCPSEDQGYTRSELESMAEDAMATILPDNLAIWQRSIAVFNSTAAAQLLANLQAATEDCELDLRVDSPYLLVESVITGQLAENADCITPFDDDDFSVYYACAPGLQCVNHEPLEGEETYVCEPLRAIGEPCSTDDAYYTCVAGAYCGDSGECVAAKADGESCESESECVSGSCMWDTEAATCGEPDAFTLYCLPRG